MIHSFIEAAKSTLDPVLRKLDGHLAPDITSSGRPKTPTHVTERLGQLQGLERAHVMAACCVANTNLGYAYEHTFKFLIFLETGRETSLRGNEGHHLPSLYKELPSPLPDILQNIYNSIKDHDYEIEEYFGKSPKQRNRPGAGPMDLHQTLSSWHVRGYLQASRYKYIDANSQSPAQILLPFRSVHLLDRIVSTQLAPKLNLAYTSIVGRA